MLGNDQGNYVSQSASTYTQMPINNYAIAKRSNASNIDLGSTNTNYNSENR